MVSLEQAGNTILRSQYCITEDAPDRVTYWLQSHTYEMHVFTEAFGSVDTWSASIKSAYADLLKSLEGLLRGNVEAWEARMLISPTPHVDSHDRKCSGTGGWWVFSKT